MAATELLGPYAVTCYRARTRAVASNKAPMAPYRGVSRPQMVLAMERLLQKAALELDLDAFRERQRRAREEGRLLGLGIICFAERTGYGTEAFNQRKMVVTPGYDSALVRMDLSGGVTVYVGTPGHGQGHLTTLAQVAADRLALDPHDIEGRQSDTDATPYGWGTFASRSAVVGGGATHRAAGRLAERLKRLAAHLLEAAPDD